MEEYDRRTVSLNIVIRPCREEDLPSLEWYGLFGAHRELIASMFERHLRGEAIMLIVEANGVASGQAWIDLDRLQADGTAFLWAVRIFPCIQNLGLGGRLLRICEQLVRDRGFRRIEATVEQNNPGAKRLYERLGYREEAIVTTEHMVSTPGWHEEGETTRQWLLRKRLAPGEGAA